MEKFVELKNILFEKAAIATLTVNRPPALNALNREVLEEMARVIREVRHDSSVRVLIMTGEMFDAKTALDWGLANQVVAPGELIDTARKLAEKLASKSAIALRQAKAALRAAFTMNEDAGLRFEQEAFGVVFGSADRVEGTAAFVEKRPPAWQHKEERDR